MKGILVSASVLAIALAGGAFAQTSNAPGPNQAPVSHTQQPKNGASTGQSASGSTVLPSGQSGTSNTNALPSSSASQDTGMSGTSSAVTSPGNGSRMRVSKDVTRQVQSELKNEGLYEGPIDGIVGPHTKTALAEYQKKKGLPQTSAIDEPTMTSLGVSQKSGSTVQ